MAYECSFPCARHRFQARRLISWAENRLWDPVAPMNRIWDPRMNLDFEQRKTCKQLFHVALLGMARRDSASSGLKTSRAVLQPIPQRARTEPRNGTQEISFGPRTATQNSAQESIQFLFRSPEMLREICARILIHDFFYSFPF